MSFTYTDFKNGQWDPTANTLGAVAVLSDTLMLALIDITLYTADPDADLSYADIPSGAIVGTEPITGAAVTNGALTFDPVVYAALVGADWAAAVVYMDSGTDATSPLMGYLDDYASAPPSPDGTDYTWNPAAGGVIQL